MNSSLPQNIPVRVEKPEGTLFGDILNDMRAWLDDNDIQPVLFKSIPMRDGGYVFYLHFQTEDEASKFRSRFDVKLDDTLDDLRKGTLTAVNSPLEKQPHILIVDDDSAVRHVIMDMLRASGYRVSPAIDGASMRDFLKAGDPIDVLVLDAHMFGESSASLALHAKELKLPVVMISGSPDAMQFALENNLQLLEKPFRIAELLQAIAQALSSGRFGQRDASN